MTNEEDLTPLVVLNDKAQQFFCRYCRSSIDMVVDPTSGCVDWGADGDFGCGGNPESNEEGSAGHAPTLDQPRFRTYWINLDSLSHRAVPS